MRMSSPTSVDRGAWLVAGLGILAWGAFWSPVLFHDYRLFAADLLPYWVPSKAYLVERLAAGEFPGWTPYVALGMPFFADVSNQVLYPGNLVLALAGDVLTGVSWFAIAHGLGGILAMGRLLRVLGVAGGPRAFGALVFGFSGVALGATANLTYLPAVVWVPFALSFALDRDRCVGRAVGAGLGVAMLLLAGDAIDAAVLCLASAAFLAYDTGVGRRARAALLVLAVPLIAAAIAAVQIAPTLELLAGSVRAHPFEQGELARWSFPPVRTLALVHPHLLGSAYPVSELLRSDLYPGTGTPWFPSVYIGLVPGAAALLALARRPRAAIPWVLLGAVALVLSYGRWIPGLAELAEGLPGVRTQRYPEKLLLWVTVSFSVLAALGLTALGDGGARGRRAGGGIAVRAGLTALVFLIPLELGLHLPARELLAESLAQPSAYWGARFGEGTTHGIGLALHGSVLCALLAGLVWLPARRRFAWGRVLAVVAVLDLLWVHYDQVPMAPATLLEPSGPPAALAALAALGRRADDAVYYDPHGPVPWLPTRLWREVDVALRAAPVRRPQRPESLVMIRFLRDRLFPSIPSRFRLRAFNGGLSPLQPAHPALASAPSVHAVLAAAGVRFVLTTVEPASGLWLRPGAVESFTDAPGNLRVLEITRRAPHYAWVEAGSGPGRTPLCAEPAEPRTCLAAAGIRIVDAQPERRVLRLEPPGRARLRIAESHDPGWEATLDGVPVPVEVTAEGYMSIPVPAGGHELVLSYRAPHLGWAAPISAATLVWAVLVLVRPRRLRAAR